MQNGFVESFNGWLRDECLNEHLFANLTEAHQIIEEWRIDKTPTDRTRASMGSGQPPPNRGQIQLRLYSSTSAREASRSFAPSLSDTSLRIGRCFTLLKRPDFDQRPSLGKVRRPHGPECRRPSLLDVQSKSQPTS